MTSFGGQLNGLDLYAKGLSIAPIWSKDGKMEWLEGNNCRYIHIKNKKILNNVLHYINSTREYYAVKSSHKDDSLLMYNGDLYHHEPHEISVGFYLINEFLTGQLINMTPDSFKKSNWSKNEAK